MPPLSYKENFYFTLDQVYREEVNGGYWTDEDGTFYDGTTSTPGYNNPTIETQDRRFQQQVLRFVWAALAGLMDARQLPPVVAGLNCRGSIGGIFGHINNTYHADRVTLPWVGSYDLPERVPIVQQYPLGFVRVQKTEDYDLVSTGKRTYQNVLDLPAFKALRETEQRSQRRRKEIDLLGSMITDSAGYLRQFDGAEIPQRYLSRIEHELVCASRIEQRSMRIRAGFGILRSDGTSLATGIRHARPLWGETLAEALSPKGMEKHGYRTWLLFFHQR